MTGRLKQTIWILPLAIAGLVVVLGWWGNGRLRETLEDQLKAQLTATLNANVTALVMVYHRVDFSNSSIVQV
jgi:hypothetical protein